MNPLEHDVEGTGQTTDFGGLVGPGHALVEVAGRNGLGGALHILQRTQAEPDQPPASGQRKHKCAGRDCELGQEKGGAMFADGKLHASPAGAAFNAKMAVSGLKAMEGDPLGKYLSPAGREAEAYQSGK